MTCTETPFSGARTGTARNTIAYPAQTILPVRILAIGVLFVAVLGAMGRSMRVPPLASGARRAVCMTAWVSVLQGPFFVHYQKALRVHDSAEE